jgi:hypothetical protein
MKTPEEIEDGGSVTADLICQRHIAEDLIAEEKVKSVGGLSVRDYFAAAALPSILSYSNEIRAKADAEWAEREGIAKPCDLNDDSADSETLSYRSSSCAIAAYIIADAMLAARKGGA